MFEMAGLIVSGIALLNNLAGSQRDLDKWTEADLRVDDEWLPPAIEKGLIEGSVTDYTWSWAMHVPTRELKGTHQVVVAYNQEKQIKYRIVQGAEANMVLTKRIQPNV